MNQRILNLLFHPVNMNTRHYYLKKIDFSEIKNIYKGLSNPEITRYYGVHYSTLEDTKEQMKWYENLSKSKTGVWWSINKKQNDEFCGAVGFSDLIKKHKKAEIGFWLLKAYWGMGILKEIMPKVFEFGFSKLHLNRVVAYVESKNIRCVNALKKK